MAGQVAWWKQGIVAVLLLGAGAGAWQQQGAIFTALGFESQADERRRDRSDGVPVIVARVAMAQDNLTLEAVGTGRAQRSVTLRPEASGKIVEMPLTGGRAYAAGDVLVRLEDAEQRLAVDLAEARLREAVRVRDRVAQLQTSGNAAAARFDEVRTAADIAALEVDRARELLAKRTLRAPFNGVAGIPFVDAGAWVDLATEIASFDDRRVILVEFDLPEALIARVAPGTGVSATSPAVPGASFEGEVVAMDTRVAAASRTVPVRVALPNAEDLLRPGASFTVRMDLTGERFPIVPELAVQFSRGSLVVWRVAEGEAEQVEVRMVRRRDGAILVDGPLREGDAVVIEGAQRLAPGKPVRVLQGRVEGSS